MLLCMLTLPFIGSLTAGLFGRLLGIKGTNFIVLSTLGSSMLWSLLLSYEVIFKGSPVQFRLGTWLDTGYLHLDWGFTMDALSSWLASTVLIISFIVHIFATSYMSSDPVPQKFMCLLLGFTASMVILVTGDTLGVIFLGWEGIGITSFLLIGYWWDRSAACNAATQALIVNRIGDCSFTLGLMLITISLSTLDLDTLILIFNSTFALQDFDSSVFPAELDKLPKDVEVLSSQEVLNNTYLKTNVWPIQNLLMKWTGVFLVIAAFGKSAQFLLHTWLPLSMEGGYKNNIFPVIHRTLGGFTGQYCTIIS